MLLLNFLEGLLNKPKGGVAFDSLSFLRNPLLATLAFPALIFSFIWGGCGQTISQNKPQSANGVEVTRASFVPPLLLEPYTMLDKGELEQAKSLIKKILKRDPDNLEGWVLAAMIYEAMNNQKEVTRAWAQVERIIVFVGKTEPFDLQPTLLAAMKHYLYEGRRNRSQVFLDELWRRFPRDEFSVRAQLALADYELHKQRWGELKAACAVLVRLRPEHSATKQCRDWIKAAKRMIEVGTAPVKGPDHWKWEHPLPQGNSLFDVWESPEGEVFAVGATGTILHRRKKDKKFTIVASPVRWNLNAVKGTSSNNVYAVGAAGVVLQFNGKKWKVIRKPAPLNKDLWGLHIFGPEKIIAVGDMGTILHGRNGRWYEQRPTTINLRGVWGPNVNLIYAVGESGTMLRFDNGRWRVMSSDSYEDLWSIWGADVKQIFIVGNRKTMIHYNGKKAKEHIIGRSHFRDIYGVDAKQAWAVGTRGNMFRYNGSTWIREASGTLVNLYGVAGLSANDMWAVGAGGTILHRSARGWSHVTGGGREELVSAIALKNGNIYALGNGGSIMTKNRGTWRVVEHLPVRGKYHALWTNGKLWVAVGKRGLMLVKSGGKWRKIETDTPEDLNGVWGWNQGAMVVGTRGTLIRYERNKVSRELSPRGLDLHDIWGVSPQSMFAVGNRGFILHYNGEEWVEQPSDVLADLFSIWGESDDSVFVAGSDGAFLRFDGARWHALESPISQKFVGIWGVTAQKVFAVSERGTIMQFNGLNWKVQSSPATHFSDICGNLHTGVFAVGMNGTILHSSL